MLRTYHDAGAGHRRRNPSPGDLVTLSNRRLSALVILALVVLTVAAYWNLAENDFTNFDDDDYVTKNPAVLAGLTWDGIVWSFTAYHAGNWHPLTWVSHMLDVTLFGSSPAGHHLTNLFLHLLNGLLLFGLLRKTAHVFWRAAFVAALFLVHPLHVESVAWLAERKDVLSTLFFMLTLWSYTRYTERPGLSRYLPTLLFFALGLAAKPMLVTLPCVLLLLDYWPLRRMRTQGTTLTDLIMEKLPLLALSVGSSIVTIQAQKTAGLVQSIDAALPLRMANAVVAYVSYIGKMFRPVNLAVYYPHPESIPLWKTAGAALILILLTVLLLRAARRTPAFAVGWLWFLGILFPVLGLVHGGGQSMADRYTYVPLVGLFVILAWGVADLARRRPLLRWVVVCVCGLSILGCATSTRAQVARWKDSVTLWEHAIAVTERNFSAHNMLATALAIREELDSAVSHYEQALRINPEHERSHNNLGLTLARLGRETEAVEHYRQALRINPRYEEALDNLGLALMRQGDLDGAIGHFSEVLRINPRSAMAHWHLGSALADQGNREMAMRHLAEALRLSPGLRGARLLLEALRRDAGR